MIAPHGCFGGCGVFFIWDISQDVGNVNCGYGWNTLQVQLYILSLIENNLIMFLSCTQDKS